MGQAGVLFWFYRDLPVCRNRLALLRRRNPGRPIFGLYGGDPADAERFRRALAPDLDDFWAFDAPVPSKWKWLHGDLLLAAWYEARGHELAWDHVFVAQWDMLVLEPLDRLLPPLAPGDVLLSGVRPVSEIAPRWVWVRGGHAAEYEAFVDAMRARFGDVEPLSCVFVVACLPRALFEAYAELDDRELGYVEYRLPTLASAVGLHVVEHPTLSAWRPADTATRPTRQAKYLNGSRRAVFLPTVLAELVRRGGARVFHPYHGLYPVTPAWAARAPGWAAYSIVRGGRDQWSARLAKRRG